MVSLQLGLKWITMNNMKKNSILYLSLGLLMVLLTGCKAAPKQDVSLVIWHYYNGAQKLAFDEFIDQFNESIGLEKGIIIEAYSQGSIGQLEEKIVSSAEKKVGASELPDMVTLYSETAHYLDQKGLISNLENYISDEELSQYVGSYIEEGRLGSNHTFKIFPTAKATEVLMLNKTDWDKFAAATGARVEDLETWEGIRKTGQLYYHWTDGLTEEKNDGKAFFGRNALANYILVGSKQLEKELLQVDQGEASVDLDYQAMKKIWDNYYIPYISGYYTSYGKFSSDDAKIGKIIALVGSTTGAAYFPDNVTVDDNESYPIEVSVLKLPNFEDTNLSAVQQGAGIVVLESDHAQEAAAVEFLKWFTEVDINAQFCRKTGYLPVKKAAYDLEQFMGTNNQDLSVQLQATIPLAMEQIKDYDLYFSPAFEHGFKARSFIESALKNKSETDREKVIELMDQGLSHEEAVRRFSTDEVFEQWLTQFEENLWKVVKDEK